MGIQGNNHINRIVHDVVNILTAIQANTDLAVVQVDRPSGLQTYLHHIRSESQRGYELLESMAQKMSGQEMPFHEVDLSTLVDETLERFRKTLPPTITLHKIDGLTFGRMRGQPTQLFRMLNNLLTNAVQAMHGLDRGTLTVMLDQVLETDPLPFQKRVSATYLRLMVRDTGRGMSADLCRRIFNPFFTTQQKAEGHGLGLAIVKEVVTAHDGVVTVESHPQCGSTLTVYFPQYSDVHPQKK